MMTRPAALAALLSALGCSSPAFSTRPGGPVAAEGPGPRAVVVVRVPTPWYAPRSVVRGKFRDVLGEYEAIEPLEAKYFSISDDGKYGGIYLWKGRPQAEHHFDEAWRAGVRQRRGVDADVLVLDAPYVVEGRTRLEGEPVGERSLAFPAVAALALWPLPPGRPAAELARQLAAGPWPAEGFVRGIALTGPASVGFVSLWATRAQAEASVAAGFLETLGQAIGASSPQVTLFETPLLVDRTLRADR